MKHIRDFEDLCEHVVGDRDCSPAYLGRCIYKYTDCGPWCRFPLKGAFPPTYEQTWEIETATWAKTSRYGLKFKAARRLGTREVVTDPQQLPERLARYLQLAYVLNLKEGRKERFSGNPRKGTVVLADVTPGTLKEALAAGRMDKGIRANHIRVTLDIQDPVKEYTHHYTERDWRTKEMEEKVWTGSMIYYEDPPAFCTDFNHLITGIEIGSIVEGSDVEIGPKRLLFPFTSDEYGQMVKEIDEEAKFYWDRDNTEWYYVRGHEDGSYLASLHWTNFDEAPEWDDRGELSDAQVEAVAEHLDRVMRREGTETNRGLRNPIEVPGEATLRVETYANDAIY